MADDPTFNPGGGFEVLAAFVAPDGFTITPVAQATPMPVALPAIPLPISPPTLLPVTWASATTRDMRNYTGVTVQVAGLSGGDTVQISENYDGSNSSVQSWVKNDFTVGNTISTNGNYSFVGGGYMTFAKTGSASTPTLTIAGNN